MTSPLARRRVVVGGRRLKRAARRARAFARRQWILRAPSSFVALARPSPQELGLAGEELAARRLLREGFVLRGRRVHTPHAEVDLWAERGGHSWVVEVKTGHCTRLPPLRGGLGAPRWDLRWRPGLSLDVHQRRRLAGAARYLARRTHRTARLALIEVLVEPDGRRVEVLTPIEVATDRDGPWAPPWSGEDVS